MRPVSGRVAVHRLIRSGSLLALVTLVAAACTTSRDEPSSAAPRTEPPTVRTTGAVPSACTPGSGIIATVAGSWPYEGADDQGYPDWRPSGDSGPATQAQLDLPSDVAVDASGNLYILETSHGPGLVRKVDPSGQITTVVGPPTDGAAPAPGEAGSLDLRRPFGLGIDAQGNLYIVGHAPVVMRVEPSGNVSTVAGTGEAGFSGDGGPATEAKISASVWDVAVDAKGNIYIADFRNDRIRKIDASGVITTVAGTGKRGFSGDGSPAEKAELGLPTGLALDAKGNLYVIDYGNGRIRRIDREGIITTVAGYGGVGFSGDGGPATEAQFGEPEKMWADPEGNLFIADVGNNRIRKIDTNGIITTVAGNGEPGFFGDGGLATDASLNEPVGATLGSDGALYIAEFESARVRKVCL